MENQEPWEPAFPAGYTLPHENAYGGSDGSCPAPEPAYPAGGHAVDISTASVSEAAAVAAAAASIARAEAAIRISGGLGSGSGSYIAPPLPNLLQNKPDFFNLGSGGGGSYIAPPMCLG